MERQGVQIPSLPVVDPEALLVRVEGDTGLLTELVELFIQECPERLAAIRRAVEGHDQVALKRAAHQFKGSLALFGAPAAVEAALQLEHISQSGGLERASEVFAVLQAQTQRVLAELAEYRG
jgi:HPt (histidine-containing phosphotransfer) domain-containing protein